MTARLLGTKDVGVRYAAHVVVSSPLGSTFNGTPGVVVRTYGDLVIVRLRSRGQEVELPFSRSELVVR